MWPVYVMLAALVLIGLCFAFLLRGYLDRRPSPTTVEVTRINCEGSFDLVIHGGMVIDGLGGEPLRADVGVRDGRIACVGSIAATQGERAIDAAGLTVAPGFIDVHTHVERNLPGAGQPFLAPNFVRQGVTTIITGNCGSSTLDVRETLERLDRHGAQVNVATFVGHNAIRRRVMQRANRPPAPRELEEMKQLIVKAMNGGALGLSTGLSYVPGTYATQDEIVALARVASGGLYISHVRDEGVQGFEAVREAIDIGERAGLPVHISHFKVAGRSQWGAAQRRLDLVEAAVNRGQHVSIDQYPYIASSTTLDVLLPSWALAGDASTIARRLRDPRMRSQVRDEMLVQLRREGWDDYSFARIAYCSSNLKLNGMTIKDVANLRLLPTPKVDDAVKPNGGRNTDDPDENDAPEENGKEKKEDKTKKDNEPKKKEEETQKKNDESKKKDTQNMNMGQKKKDGELKKKDNGLKVSEVADAARLTKVSAVVSDASVERQAEVILDLVAKGGAQMIYFEMSENDLSTIMRYPRTMFGSDSSVRREDTQAVPHPRGYGTFPKVLARYVRQTHTLTLAEAVRRMTSLPAQTFGLGERGQITPGYWADLVIFQDQAIADHATYENPLAHPSGVSRVIVNGEVVFERQNFTGAYPGKGLRRQHSADDRIMP